MNSFLPRPTMAFAFRRLMRVGRDGSSRADCADNRHQEYRELIENAPEGVTAGPLNEDDFLLWEALIDGPAGSPYEDGVFRAQVGGGLCCCRWC